MGDYLDTNALKNFIDRENDIKNKYSQLNSSLTQITSALIKNDWRGLGADAFSTDIKKVMHNVSGVEDILKTMCDTLNDCLTIFEKSDISLGKVNKDT